MRDNGLVHLAGPAWFLEGGLQGRFPHAHSVVIRDRGETLLIDAGAGEEILKDFIERYRPDAVLNTHNHIDHTLGNHLFHNIPVLVSDQSPPGTGNILEMSRRFVGEGELGQTWREWVRDDLGLIEYTPDGAYSCQGEIQVGRVRLQVIHTPGHTRDHCCFWLPEQRLLVGGDLDLNPFGPWYGHAESDPGEFERSVQKALDLDPAIFVPAHSPVRTGEVREALLAYVGVIEERDERLFRFLLRGERTRDQIVEKALIYGRFPFRPWLLRYFEGQMIDKHLERLARRGRVRWTGEGWLADG